ncbi:hypothetical protein [Jannaschia sp. 2305UL9-9]|uniref:hypothetical protein n=1 Tax=Jannaschia sp. 2305UL9-9 TaxID=3121638 RepID=UPI0035294687
MIRVAAILIALAGSVSAQGLPQPMAPCLATHFDADRYRADLEALGWAFIPALSRATQIDRLADAFGALSVPEGTAPEDIDARSRAIWRDRGEEAMIFEGGGQTLMMAGVVADDDSARVTIRCYLTVPDPATLTAGFDAASAQGKLTEGTTQSFSVTQRNTDLGQTFEITFVRPDPTTASTAPAGLATRFDFPATAD